MIDIATSSPRSNGFLAVSTGFAFLEGSLDHTNRIRFTADDLAVVLRFGRMTLVSFSIPHSAAWFFQLCGAVNLRSNIEFLLDGFRPVKIQYNFFLNFISHVANFTR